MKTEKILTLDNSWRKRTLAGLSLVAVTSILPGCSSSASPEATSSVSASTSATMPGDRPSDVPAPATSSPTPETTPEPSSPEANADFATDRIGWLAQLEREGATGDELMAARARVIAATGADIGFDKQYRSGFIGGTHFNSRLEGAVGIGIEANYNEKEQTLKLDLRRSGPDDNVLGPGVIVLLRVGVVPNTIEGLRAAMEDIARRGVKVEDILEYSCNDISVDKVNGEWPDATLNPGLSSQLAVVIKDVQSYLRGPSV